MSKENVSGVAMLLNGLMDEDVNGRLNSMKHIVEIAKALKPERTRKELIPFITETCCDDEDDVLFEFASAMGRFIDLVGGIEFSNVLLAPLQILCKIEETQVREKAVESVVIIINEMKKQKKIELIEKYIFPVFISLADNKWYTSRSSACGIIGEMYPVISTENKSIAREKFRKLSNDQTPMARRYVAKYLAVLCGVYEKEYIIGKMEKENLFSIFDKLRKDDQDSVRLLSIDNAIALTKVISTKEAVNLILPVIKSLGKDKSWRVRYMVADKFSKFCETIGSSVTQSELISLFSNLCLDKEPEVRTAAAFQIAGVCALLSKDQVIAQILPTIKKIVLDSNEHVRSALASVIMSISAILGKEYTVQYLLEHFLVLLKDSFSDVRLNLIAKLSDVNSVIGAELLSESGLMDSIMQLSNDKQWRVRLSVIKHIPLLAKQLGKNYFDVKLIDMCIKWLSDSVYSIREAATQNIVELTKIFGEQWTKDNLFEGAIKLKQSPNYLYRMILLFLISGLSKIVSNETVMELLPHCLALSEDPVPNIRFNVAKTLDVIIVKLDKSAVKNKVVGVLDDLLKDEDEDVRKYSETAMKSAKKYL